VKHYEPGIFSPKSLGVQKYPFSISQVLQALASSPVGVDLTSQNSFPATGIKKFSLFPHFISRHFPVETCNLY